MTTDQLPVDPRGKRLRVGLLTLQQPASFIRRDEEVLRASFEVERLTLGLSLPGLARRLAALPAFVARNDVIFVWFADVHAAAASALAKSFGKPCIVVIGGYDAANVPEIGYGIHTYGSIRRLANRYAVANADALVAVDPSLLEDAELNTGRRPKRGIYIPTGYDSGYFQPKGEKEQLVLTVAGLERRVLDRKGLWTFLEAARLLPDVRFVIVGKDQDGSAARLAEKAPPNLELTGYLRDEELLGMYQRANVYCQLSRYEGLPNALCEAMLCEAAPVGTPYCGIPRAIGDTGWLVPYDDAAATAGAIREALGASPVKRQAARARIMTHFPEKRRREELTALIEGLVHEHTRWDRG